VTYGDEHMIGMWSSNGRRFFFIFFFYRSSNEGGISVWLYMGKTGLSNLHIYQPSWMFGL